MTLKKGYFVNSIENLHLHKNKFELGLKAIKTHANKNSFDKKVYARIQLYKFDFETEILCTQAQDSLLNCFPFDCAKLVKQIDKSIKTTPSIFILKAKTIIIARINCEQVDEKWNTFIKELTNAYAEDNDSIILTECGILKWMNKQKINAL